MTSLSCALALLGGVIGAGFASGREIAHFFSSHGAMAPVAMALSAITLFCLFIRLPAQLERSGCAELQSLCRARFGQRFGRLCAALFTLLFAATGGAMLAACAELAALTLPIRPAYAVGLAVSLIAGVYLARRGVSGLMLPGVTLCILLPVLLIRLCLQPPGEAAFAPVQGALHAAASGACYGALNAAMVCGMLPLLLPLSRGQRMRAVSLFALLFTALLSLGVAVLARHHQAAWGQPLPLVALSRMLGKGGYSLCAGSMYATALSTFCAMLTGLSQTGGLWRGALCCLLFAAIGFDGLIAHAYPVLGWLCAGLMALLCLPLPETKMDTEKAGG